MPTVPAPLPPIGSRLAGVRSSPVRDLLALVGNEDVISFAGGLPAPELFDVEGLREAYAQALTGDAARRNLQYAASEGDPALRELVAARLTRRSLPTEPDDLLITTGSQQALSLLTTALLEPGAVVAVEEPSYLAALQSFALAGARVVGIAADEHGVVPASVEEVLREHRPRVLYLVPNFANPTGRTLPAPRRARIAELAAEHGTWVVEDDPYGELRYSGEHVAPLAADPALADRCVHLGSFSKTGAPGLRLGWARVPRSLRPALVVAKQAADLQTSTVDQAAAAVYLARTDLDAHVATVVAAYRERRDAALAALADALPAGSSWSRPEGGMFTWVRLPDPGGTLDTASLLPGALAAGVAFVPGEPFFAGAPDRATLRLSFTTHTPARIHEGVARLGTALEAALGTVPASG
ncbi:PLP-dependent aminotransferase family protein [Kineococcus radiotolerans]|uniref:Transcriptional regulator, GntR family n=1 Tax=Kineococcus radiotolerans (strain ATCC BAA-149 / DSM 14245 / SRS30216) TaxID=266940 RepID=A6WE09_KINRD|nr:PLP-dependent aminotransferase family protein [Kineococcus radiotolerans]ABS05048.1 putative transcriptional regulator, GntR family [Kineococcus radiotolerans SRS30216 = ATCC BAA-149]